MLLIISRKEVFDVSLNIHYHGLTRPTWSNVDLGEKQVKHTSFSSHLSCKRNIY